LIRRRELWIESNSLRFGATVALDCRYAVQKIWDQGRLVFVPWGRIDFRNSGAKSTWDIDFLVPVNPGIGYISECSNHRLIFNGGFFLDLEEEFDPFSFAGDPVGLTIVDGNILNPPIYRRTALLIGRGISKDGIPSGRYASDLGIPTVAMKSVSMADCGIEIPEIAFVRGEAFRESLANTYNRLPQYMASLDNPSSGVDIFTRSWVSDDQAGWPNLPAMTPKRSTHVDYIISGRSIRGRKEGGGTYIPSNGYVLSVPITQSDALVQRLDEFRADLRYHLSSLPGLGMVQSGIQVGVPLIEYGHKVSVQELLASHSEVYRASALPNPKTLIPPSHLTPDKIVNGKISRLAVGVTADYHCFVVAIEGCESRSIRSNFDSQGADVGALQDICQNLGCHTAVALDGGGSATIFVEGRPLFRPSDRHDVALLPRERLVPGMWAVD